MKTIFLIESFVSLLVVFIFMLEFFLKIKRHHKKIRVPLSVIFGGYLFVFFMSILWFLGYLQYNSYDFLLIYSLVLFLQSLAFFKIFYSIKKHKKLFLGVFAYILISIALFIEIKAAVFIIAIAQLFLVFLFNYFLKKDELKTANFFGIIYGSVSILLLAFLLHNKDFVLWFSIILNLFFSVFIYFFLKNIRKSEFFHAKKKKHSYFIEVMRYFIFILVLTNFIFIGTISVHELGHLTTSKLLECKYQKIVYENNLPETQVLCLNEKDGKIAIVGGVLFPILVALLFFFGGGKFIKEIGLLILGFNLIIAYKDYLDLGLSQNIAVSVVFLGTGILIAGIGLLAKSRTEETKFERYLRHRLK